MPTRSERAVAPELPEDAPGRRRAVVQRAYGEPDRVLGLESLPVPEPGPGEVRVRVTSAALHRGDRHLVHGWPHLVRLAFGLRRPRLPVPGWYAAGTVEAVGPGVRRLRVGDEVFGTLMGCWTERAVGPESELVIRPPELDPDEAASLPHGGFAALQALRDVARLRAGERVLVHGASGAVGVQAVQLARAMGAHVTATCGASAAAFVRELGADALHEHDAGGRALPEGPFDVVVDNRRDRPDRELRRLLAPGGRVVMVTGGKGNWLGGMGGVLLSALRSRFASRRFHPFLARTRGQDLPLLLEHVGNGSLRVPVDRAFGLDEVPRAFAHLDRRASRGALVIRP